MPVDVETEIVTEHSREEVAAVASGPSKTPEWYVNIRSVEWNTRPPVSKGSRAAFVAHFPGDRFTRSTGPLGLELPRGATTPSTAALAMERP